MRTRDGAVLGNTPNRPVFPEQVSLPHFLLPIAAPNLQPFQRSGMRDQRHLMRALIHTAAGSFDMALACLSPMKHNVRVNRRQVLRQRRGLASGCTTC